MKKKKAGRFDAVLRWWKQVALSIIVIPLIAMSWKHAQAVWATPEKVDELDGTVGKHETAKEQFEKLIVNLDNRVDKAEAVYAVQIQALEKQIQAQQGLVEVVAEMKRKQ